jgi:hypothetical protein
MICWKTGDGNMGSTYAIGQDITPLTGQYR